MTLTDDYYRNPDHYPNVLYLDDDPEVAAKLHCDRHVGKMIMVTSQILSTVWHGQELEQLQLDWGPPVKGVPFGELKCMYSTLCGTTICRPRHQAHPSVQWAALYGGNYAWLYRLGLALLAEFTYRFERIHSHTALIRFLELMPPALEDTADKWCDAPAVVPVEFILDGVNESYQNYYIKEKTVPLQYTRRKPPRWLNDAAIFISN